MSRVGNFAFYLFWNSLLIHCGCSIGSSFRNLKMIAVHIMCPGFTKKMR